MQRPNNAPCWPLLALLALGGCMSMDAGRIVRCKCSGEAAEAEIGVEVRAEPAAGKEKGRKAAHFPVAVDGDCN